jgi:membrane protein
MNVQSVRDRLDRVLLGRLIERILELNPFERSLVLGSKLFTAVVPLSILLSAVVGKPNVLTTRLIDGFGLTGEGASAMTQLFEVPSAQVWNLINLIGLLVAAYSLLSFARALQRIYENAWHLVPPRSHRITWGSVWVVVFAVYFSLSSPFARLLYEHGLRVSGTIVSLIGGTILWLVTPFILLGRRVPLRVLAPGGLASAVLLLAFTVGSDIYLPHSMTANVHRYGLVGVTFSLLTWLFAFSVTLVVAAACGAVLGERRSDWTDPRRSEPTPPPDTGQDGPAG